MDRGQTSNQICLLLTIRGRADVTAAVFKCPVCAPELGVASVSAFIVTALPLKTTDSVRIPGRGVCCHGCEGVATVWAQLQLEATRRLPGGVAKTLVE